MGSRSLKSPPQFDPDNDNYEQFKKDLQIWDLVTDLEAKKRGPAVYLSLNKKVREAVRSLSVEQINNDNGLKAITDRLDEVYLADKNTRAYTAFQNFYKCKRESGETFEQFIIKFERLYSELVNHDLTLPEGIKAFFVLNSANLTDEMEKLARATTTELTYKAMKDQIKKICGTTVSQGNDDFQSAPPIKDEVLFTHGRGGYRGRGRGGKGGRGGSYKPSSSTEGAKGGSQKQSSSTENPVNQYGIKMRCYACDSLTHMVANCPKKNEVEEVNIVLLNSKPDNKQKNLVLETLGKGLLDSGCTRTVAGEFWMNEFLSTIPPADKLKISEVKSDAIFRFGDGAESRSAKKVTIPIKIGSKKYQLQVDVVKNDIPLLISKPVMKKLGISESGLDLKNDLWVVDDEKIKLQCTSSGHYCLPLSVFYCGDSDSKYNITLSVNEIDKLSKTEKMTKVLKLHRQFGHASEDKLLKLVKNSSIKDKEFLHLIGEVCNTCDICREYKAAPLKPIVSLPLAEKFNDVVCLDLKEYVHNKVWILHMIDAATRYSQARLITSKKKEVIVSKIFEMWISSFGVPRTLMSDNGGEFVNNVYTEASQKLGIKMVMPPAESPFSNGIVERHNKIIYETMMKTKDDAKCEPEVALAWACSAKNALQNNNGYSPNQLVFGHNVNLPSTLTDNLPALKTTTSNEIIRKNLQALHDARKNYIVSENSNRIKRALRHKTRSYSDETFQTGESVYFKRNGYKGWLGPARVLGFDGYTVLVKLGGSIYKCHRCHLMKQNSMQYSRHRVNTTMKKSDDSKNVDQVLFEEDSSSDSDTENPDIVNDLAEAVDTQVVDEAVDEQVAEEDGTENQVHDVDDGEQVENDIENQAALVENQENVIINQDEQIEEDTNETTHSDTTACTNGQTQDEAIAEHDTVQNIDSMEEQMRNLLGDDISILEANESQPAVDNMEEQMRLLMGSDISILDQNVPQQATEGSDVEVEAVNTQVEHEFLQGDDNQAVSQSVDNLSDDYEMQPIPKNDSFISIKMYDADEWSDALVLSTQPKRKGVNKHWVNIHIHGEDDPKAVNWAYVAEWKPKISPPRELRLTSEEQMSQPVIDAKNKEYNNLVTNKVFDEVQYEGQKLISTRWVFTEKIADGKKIVKARLVARGFEEDSASIGVRTDSPTCTRHSLRLVMITAVSKGWTIKSVDVASAFLQGREIDRDVYIKPPAELCEKDKVWKLRRCLYGLNDAPREWYNALYDEFIALGAVRSTLDNAMFMWYKGDEIIGHLCTHVDDFNYAGTDDWQVQVIEAIKTKFKFRCENEGSYMYLGLNVQQTNDCISIDQKHYIEKLEEIPVRKGLNPDPLSKDEKACLKSLSGQML